MSLGKILNPQMHFHHCGLSKLSRLSLCIEAPALSELMGADLYVKCTEWKDWKCD